eukprot:TRINITY_DN4145_c0_g1_i1.p1 TRINITY_DN4145_c0_g1~~TRINITY_DN4145_c0_g1_i1.p1  ORF type:complete len:334 (-),score=48.34 TRINITY_DN4145_c0_g1_i1:39-1040(-)
MTKSLDDELELGGNINDDNGIKEINKKTNSPCICYFIIIFLMVFIIMAMYWGFFFPVQYASYQTITKILLTNEFVSDNKLYISPFPDEYDPLDYGVEHISKTCLYKPTTDYIPGKMVNCTKETSSGLEEEYFCPLGYLCFKSEISYPYLLCASSNKDRPCSITDCDYQLYDHPMKNTDDPFLKYINVDFPTDPYYVIATGTIIYGFSTVLTIILMVLIYIKTRYSLNISVKSFIAITSIIISFFIISYVFLMSGSIALTSTHPDSHYNMLSTGQNCYDHKTEHQFFKILVKNGEIFLWCGAFALYSGFIISVIYIVLISFFYLLNIDNDKNQS